MTMVANLLSAFGIRSFGYRDGGMSSEQILEHAITDHRGRIEMSAYAVMVESVTSGAFWYSFNAPVGTVQSWLSLTAAAPAVSPRPWMANPLGAMQGGVVAAIISQACSFAGHLYAGPGQKYALGDLTASFWRSPPVDIGEIAVTTMLDKLGRRIGTVSATMTGPDDVPLARAVADIQHG